MSLLNQYPYPKPGVIGRVVNNEAVIVQPDKGEVKVLNEVGARIWSLADGTRSLAEIVDVLHAEFLAERSLVERDALAFVGDLVDRGIFLLSNHPQNLPTGGV